MATSTNLVFVDGVECKRIAGRLLMTYKTAAEYRGCTYKTVANEVRRGDLNSYRIGRFAYIDKDEMDANLLGTAA